MKSKALSRYHESKLRVNQKNMKLDCKYHDTLNGESVELRNTEWLREDCSDYLPYVRVSRLGFEAPNLRKLADKIAGAGYFVAVPDCFNKDTFIPGASPLGDWLKNHHPVDFLEDARKLVDTLKTKGFSSVGAAGFCWGAKVVVDLAKNDFLKAAVLCHPSLVTVEDISAVKTPLAVLAAEIDQMTPPELAKQFSEILESNKEVESFFHLYPGVAHGWTVRYDVNDESAVIRAEEAHCKMMEWFGKFLH